VFVDMGLITKVDRGKGKTPGIQVTMDKLGLDLRAEFAAAHAVAQRKKVSKRGGIVRSQKCLRDSVSETPKNVSATLFDVSETVPPHPLIGGTVSEPPLNLPPIPPQAGADEFTPEQLAHIDELRTTGRRADAAMWEAFYCKQNLKDAEIAEEERAKAKRLEMLRQTLPDEPSAVAWVMNECGFVGDERRRGVRGAIAEVIAMEHARGRPLWELAPAMVTAWRDYDRIFAMLAVPYGPLKFFRLNIWQRRNSWRIDDRKRERLGASVGSEE